jgi:pimeloyl-ACP methyl ester carboxylesterase
MPSRNGAVVVFLHGSPGDRSGFLPLLKGLSASGYGAILLDMPGHGESGGRADWGTSSQLAVEAAIDLALKDSGVSRIALFGYSMGGCVAAQVAMRDKRVTALVLLSTFTNLADALRHEYRSRVPMLEEFAVFAARSAGVPVDEMLTAEALRASPPRPVLIVGGTADRIIPASMLEALYQAAPGPKELWIVEGAGHVGLRERAGPELFDGRLRTFLDRAMQR